MAQNPKGNSREQEAYDTASKMVNSKHKALDRSRQRWGRMKAVLGGKNGLPGVYNFPP